MSEQSCWYLTWRGDLGGAPQGDSARGNNAAGNGKVREGAGEGWKEETTLGGPYLV